MALELSDDVFSVVLSFCDYQDQLLSIEPVCKRWFDQARRLCATTVAPAVVSPSCVGELVSHPGLAGLQDLTITQGEVTSALLCQIPRALTNLSALRIHSMCTGVGEHVSHRPFICSVARQAAGLQVLELGKLTHLNAEELSNLAPLAPSLRELSITCCTCLPASLGIIPTFAKLEVLDLSWCIRVGDESIRQLAAGGGGALRRLILRGCEDSFSDAAARELIAIKSLRCLDLSYCDMSAAGIQTLAEGLPLLESLRLAGDCGGLGAVSVDSLAHLARLARLRELGLTDSASVTDQVMAELATLPALQSLDISECRSVTDAGLAAFVQGARARLRELSMNNCKGLTDESFRVISASSSCTSSLETLKCAFCHITDIGLKALSNKLERLSTLTIVASSITDSGVRELAASAPSLTALDLSACDYVSDAGLQSLATHARLKELDISGCQVGEGAVLGLAASAPELMRLAMVDCPGDTHRARRALGRRYHGGMMVVGQRTG